MQTNATTSASVALPPTGTPAATTTPSAAAVQTPAGAPTLAQVNGILGPQITRYGQQCAGGDRGACAVQTNMQGTSNQLRQWAASCAGGDQNACSLYGQNARAIMLMPSLTGQQPDGSPLPAPGPGGVPPQEDGGSRRIPQAQAEQIQMAATALRRAIATAQQRCQAGDANACSQGQQLTGVQQQLYRLFQACSGGDQAACAQHDRAVAQIAAAAQNAQNRQSEDAPRSESGFSQR